MRNFIPVDHTSLSGSNADNNVMESPSFLSKLQIMERMVVQNATMGITMDYKYWDDPADHYQEEGIFHINKINFIIRLSHTR